MTSGPAKMSYRAYEIGRDNRIVAAVLIEAETDETALQNLRQIADGRAFELWDRGRLVARIALDGAARKDGATSL